MSAASANTKRFAISLIVLAAIGFVVGSSQIIYDVLYTGATDIYPTWQGGKLFWQDGTSPYDDEVGEKSQAAIYEDEVADEGEDEFQFVYPFYLILYMGPLPLLEFRLAATIFMEILLLLLGGTLVLSVDTLRWLPKPLTLGIAILVYITSYFSVRGLLLAQPAFLAYAFHIGAYWAISRGYDRGAGVLLALSTIKPQTGYLLVPLLLLWAWSNHRRTIAYAFAAMFGALFLGSMILLPTWFIEWMARVFNYRDYTETLATIQIITHSIDAMPDVLQFGLQAIISLLVLVPVGLYWWRAILQRDSSNFLWGLMLTMTVSVMVSPRTATTYYIELYPVLLVTMLFLEQRRQWLWLVLGALVFVVAYWVLVIATLPEEAGAGSEAPIVYVIFPTLIYGWLLLQRHTWKTVDILRPSLTQGTPS